MKTEIPRHLPGRLSIDLWIWSWIGGATPGESYDDLQRCILEAKERGFNTIRLDAGLNWAFRPDGTPRGEMEFGPWIRGYGWNFSTVNYKGGGRHDVLRRLIQLFELAARHNVYVILTSWEYQDSTWLVADPAIRKEVYAIPPEQRFMHLARQHDRLLTLLKERGLGEQVAFVEVHNEPEHSDFPNQRCPEGKRLHEEAIVFLRERHPDILIGGDFSGLSDEHIPDSTQIYDKHVYAGASWYFEELYGRTVLHPEFDPANPRTLPVLDRVLRDELVPWNEFMKPAENVRQFWRPIMWLYENLDNEKWDTWVAESFGHWQDRIWAEARRQFAENASAAYRRELPLVLDEGGFFYPPRFSRFEISQTGLSLLDLFTDLAVEYNYWGYMPGTYIGPEHLIWHENPDWLRRTNERFLAGRRRAIGAT